MVSATNIPFCRFKLDNSLNYYGQRQAFCVMQPSSPLYPDAAGLATIASGSTAGLNMLVDYGSYQLLNFRRQPADYEINGVTSHVVALQNARNPKVNYRVGDKRYTGVWERGACSILPAKTSWRATLDQGIDITAIWLSPAFCERLLGGFFFNPMPLFNHRHIVLSQILKLLTLSAEVVGSSARLYHDGLVTSLVAYLADRHGVVGSAIQRGGLPPARLRRILELIEAELQNEINVSILAAEADISERHFFTVFHRSMGLSPHRYVIQRRVERAKKMLRIDQSKSITEIAIDVGFKSSSHFSTTFLNLTAMTPLAFRKLYL